MEEKGRLFTIGHSVHSLEKFVQILKMHDVNYVLDCRSTPYSRYAGQFNREGLARALAGQGITYAYMGRHFGARRTEPEFYAQDGYVDFEKVRGSEIFRQGLDNVKFGLSQGNRIALMCTEKDPIDCHRAIMVARGFELAGVEAQHIMADGSLQSQDVLNERLLERYFPDGGQISLTDVDAATDREAWLVQAYQIRNEEIGYRKKRNTR